ncbi:MAG: C25 family cysteine peptidase [Thermodesulfobacteriota bacterium]|nr:C25 family cysteine peptidase [Thermodesulfobacteriota bacterium]
MPRKAFGTIGAVVLFLSACGMFFSGPVQAGQRDIEVLSTDDHSLILELKLPPFEIKDVQGPDGPYQRIRLKGWAKTSRPGYPELPVCGVLIRVPQSGRASLQILDTVHESLPGCRIYPVPRLLPSSDGSPVTEFLRHDDFYNFPGTYPRKQVEIDSPCVFRDTLVARVMFFPFQWNPATKELLYSTTIRLLIEFEDPVSPLFRSGTGSFSPGSGASDTNSLFERLKQETIINYGRPKGPHSPRADFLAHHQTSSIGSTAIRIEVREDGAYGFTYGDLLEEGLSPKAIWGMNPLTFRLFRGQDEVPIRVNAPWVWWFVPGDSVEFYGFGLDNSFTDTNVYRLDWGSGIGRRMEMVDGTVTGYGKVLGSFYRPLHFEENSVMWEAMPGAPEEDYWFWEKITAPATSRYTIAVPSPAKDQNAAVVRLCFRGRSTASPHPNHHTKIHLNGAGIGDDYWDGETEYIQEMTISPALFSDGDNTLTVEAAGDTGASVDVIYLNWIEVDYWSYFNAVEDRLDFTVNGDERLQFRVNGFSRPAIRVYDVTDVFAVKEVFNSRVLPWGLTYTVVFEDHVAGSKTYSMLTENEIARPNVAAWMPANLKGPHNGADYVVITARDFLPSVRPLCLLRRAGGLRVRAVSIEDIYSEFNYGVFDPGAIKDFLKYAYENWEPPAPTYVLFVGDANTDYRDYFGTGKKNIVPVHLSVTELGLTPDDNWFVCVQGEDILPEMMVGRIPGCSAGAVADLVDKIIDFEQAGDYGPGSVLFAADDGDMGFQELNEELAALLPPEFTAEKVYLGLYGDVNKATEDLIRNMNQGMMISNYVGHGGVTNWAGEYMFSSSDIPDLANQDLYTFAVMMTCLNGYFSQPYYYCLAEELLAAANGGAIACFAPSGLGYLWEHEILDNELFKAVFEEWNNVFGLITTRSKIAAYAGGASEDTVRAFTLFGDPASGLKTVP